MKQKHINMRFAQCRALAALSPCPRRRYGAVIVDPTRRTIVSDGDTEDYVVRDQTALEISNSVRGPLVDAVRVTVVNEDCSHVRDRLSKYIVRR